MALVVPVKKPSGMTTPGCVLSEEPLERNQGEDPGRFSWVPPCCMGSVLELPAGQSTLRRLRGNPLHWEFPCSAPGRDQLSVCSGWVVKFCSVFGQFISFDPTVNPVFLP